MNGNKVCALCGADFHSTVECPWRVLQAAPVAVPEWLKDPESFRDRLHEAGYRGEADAQGTGAEAMRLEILAAAPQPPVQQAAQWECQNCGATTGAGCNANGCFANESEPAPAQDERAAFEAKFPIPAHCIRCGDSYAATEFHAWGAQEYSKIRQGWLAALEWQATRPAQSEQQPWTDAMVRDFLSVALRHVEVKGMLHAQDIRDALRHMTERYATPIAQTAQSQPEQSEVQRLREALEKIAKISRDSIHYHPSYMSRIARSALDPKGFDPVEASMRSALSAHRAQQGDGGEV